MFKCTTTFYYDFLTSNQGAFKMESLSITLLLHFERRSAAVRPTSVCAAALG